MTVRTDITVNFDVSPRIITIASSSVELTLQDLVDTVRDIEDELVNMDNDHLINASGKEDLGGSVSVGITIELQNAQVRFEERVAKLESGSITTATTVSTSGTIALIDSAANFATTGSLIGGGLRGASVINFTDQSFCTILSTGSEVQLNCTELTGGIDNDFDVSDVYAVYPTVQCNVAGGNLVAVDITGSSLDPIFGSFATQIVRTSSSSATLQNQESLEFSSFGGGVAISVVSGAAGTIFPLGTRQNPVNNLIDAHTIADERGLLNFFLLDSVTTFNTSDFSDGHVFIGESRVLSKVVLPPNASVANCTFQNVTVTGTLDGKNSLQDCSIVHIDFVNGFVEHCAITGSITVGGGHALHLISCHAAAAAGNDFSIIDLMGSGSSVHVRDWQGGLEFRNFSGSDDLSVDMSSGHFRLDSTMESGSITVRGVGALTDNSGIEMIVTSSDLLSSQTVSEAVWDRSILFHTGSGTAGEILHDTAFHGRVTIDSISGSAGTMYPLGTPFAPVNNLADAKTIADLVDLKEFFIQGSASMTQDFKGFHFEGDLSDVLILNGHDVSDSEFVDIEVTGAFSGSGYFLKSCLINNVEGFEGTMEQGFVLGEVCLTGTIAVFADVHGGNFPVINAKGGGTILAASNMSADWTISNMGSSPSPTIVRWGMTQGVLTFSASCVAGFATVDGLTTIVDNSGPGMILTDFSLNRGYMSASSWIAISASYLSDDSTGLALHSASLGGSTSLTPGDLDDIADSVWDESLVAHTASALVAGTTLFSASLGSSTPSAIADEVWNTVIVGHTGSNTFGEVVAKKLLKFSLWLALK